MSSLPGKDIRAPRAPLPHASALLSAVQHIFCIVPGVRRIHSAGTLRLLFATALAAFLLPAPGEAATLRWEALPDRERVTITLGPTEGVPGTVARVSPTGVLVPFTELPDGLLVERKPEGAVIFQGTKPLGRALALVTSSPEFGFVVTKQNPGEVVVELFPDKLGARWRPTEKAPVTEIPPDFAVPDLPPALPTHTIPAPANQAEPVTTPPSPEQPGPSNTHAAPAAPPAPAQPASPPPAAETLPQPAPVQRSAVPVVITPDGTPLTGPAARPIPGTEPAESPAPPSAGQPVPVTAPAPSAAPGPTPPLQNDNGTPMLDIRPETEGRGAPLPQPLEPSTARPPATAPTAAPAVSPAAQPSAPAVPNQPPATPQPQAQAAPPPQAQPQAPPPPPVAPPIPRAAPRKLEPVLIPGVGVPSPDDNLSKGRVHMGSLETIKAPSEDSLLDVPPMYPDVATRLAADRAAAEARKANATANMPQKIYVDEQGNPVEPPADPTAMLPEIRQDILTGNFAPALEKAEKLLKQSNVDASQREELLHIRADMIFALNKDSLKEHYPEIINSTQQAMAFNQQSRRNAAALLRLGYVNLKVGSIPEARSAFNQLRRLYPDDENVPLTYYYWGDHHYGRNEVQDAADQFQYILQQYPDSRYAREAALGLARSYYRLGYYEQSFNVVGYIEKRWPRFYLEYPPFLNMMGDTAFRLNRLDEALKQYRLYINLEPTGPEADVILTRMGDIYALQKEKGAAREMYTTAAQRFPDKDGGLVARMRLVEEGIYDEPSMSGMFSTFDKSSTSSPPDVYREIITKHPESSLVPLAELKLAMWYLWNKQYMETLQACTDFMKKYPNHELAPKVQETALKTFAALAAQGRDQGTYSQMHEAWERFPIVRNKEEMLSPESRLALAVSYWNNKQPQEALAVVEPFFLGDKVPKVSESALQLVLSIYLEYDYWTAIREVARRVELWELTPEVQQQLDYALALAGENLGEPDEAAPVWQKLYDSGSLPPARMANAAFFLARDAERKRNLEQAYIYGNEALNRLLEEARKTPALADTGKIKTQLGSLIDVSEAAGRLRESLDYAQRYLEYLPEGDPERVGVLYRTARIYRKQGNVEAWKKGLTDLAATYPDTVYGRMAASELQGAAITDDAAGFSPTGQL